LDKQAFSGVRLTPLSPHRGLSAKRANVWTRLDELLTDGQGLVIATTGLENGRPHRGTLVMIDAEAFGLDEIGKRLGKAMKSGARARPYQESATIGGRGTHELFGQRLSALVIRNASEKLSTEGQQFDNHGALRDSQGTVAGETLLSTNLRLEIAQGDSAICRPQLGLRRCR
jgi:hypothetical protein